MNGSDIVITYDGATNITPYCLFSECSFESQMAAVPGQFSILVKDVGQTLDFTTGKEITLDIDGVRMYGGYVKQVTKRYAFPADNTLPGAATVRSRQWVLTGLDYNVLLDALILRYPSDYTHHVPNVTGDPWDGEVIRNWFDNYFDLPSGFNFSSATYIKNHHQFTKLHRYKWMTQGSTMRDVLDDLAQRGSVYYIGPDKQFNFVGVQEILAPWGFSDNPNNDPIGVGVPTRGFRDGEFTENASSVINDVIVWGGSEWTPGGDIVYSRRQNSTSISEHRRWQAGENRVGEDNYKSQAEVTARAKVVVDGDKSGVYKGGSQGLVQPEQQFRCIWFSVNVPTSGGNPVHLRPPMVVPIELWVFSQDGGTTPFLAGAERNPDNLDERGLPLRQVRVTFPSLDPDGNAYAQFEGTFGVLMSDPYWLWAFLRKGPKKTNTLVTAANNSSDDPANGAQYQDQPSPAPNGVIQVFTIPWPYIANTSQVFLYESGSSGGTLQGPTQVSESDPAAGEFTFTNAPAADATIWVTATLR